MNIIRKDFEDHSEISIRNAAGQILHAYVFDDKEEAKAFIQGWRCCQSVINGLVQSLPQNFDSIQKG